MKDEHDLEFNRNKFTPDFKVLMLSCIQSCINIFCIFVFIRWIKRSRIHTQGNNNILRENGIWII